MAVVKHHSELWSIHPFGRMNLSHLLESKALVLVLILMLKLKHLEFLTVR